MLGVCNFLRVIVPNFSCDSSESIQLKVLIVGSHLLLVLALYSLLVGEALLSSRRSESQDLSEFQEESQELLCKLPKTYFATFA